MPRPTGLRPPAPTAPRGSTRGGASKRVAETALWVCRTVATGGRTAMRQRSPRAGTFAPDFRTKLPRKRGSGGRLPLSGGRLPLSRGDVERSETEGIGLWPKARGGRVGDCGRWAPTGTNPRRFFGGFLIAQKATRRRGGEISPIKRYEPTGGASPRPTGVRPPAPTAPRGSTSGGASKRVAETALWVCHTVATGGRTAMRQRPPCAGTFAPGFRTKLPRKRGSGGRLPLSGGDGRRPEGVG